MTTPIQHITDSLKNIIDYPVTPHKNKYALVVNVPQKSDRKSIIMIIQKELELIYPTEYLDKFHCKSGCYSSVGVLKIIIDSINYYILVKDSHNGSTLHDITARTFTGLSDIIKIDNDEFYTFSSIKQLEDSIIKGCLDTPSINNATIELFKNFFITGELDWTSIQPKTLITKLGIYLSEILIGWIFLSNRQSEFINTDDEMITNAQVKLFCVPCNSNYNDIDSFLILENDTRIAISNKFGNGAPASFFTGIMSQV